VVLEDAVSVLEVVLPRARFLVSPMLSQHLPVVQTEHKAGNYPWLTPFNSSQAPNDHAYAVESWGLIRDWIKAGVSSYNAWNMVLDTVGVGLDSTNVWPQNALLTVSKSTNSLDVTPAYYVFRHLSQYVDPGAVRIGATASLDSLDALAFKNPTGSIVTIVYNSGSSARKMIVALGATKLQFDVPANGWATVVR
jgi:glucosylceramidase